MLLRCYVRVPRLPVARTRIITRYRRWAARCAAIRGGNAKWALSLPSPSSSR